ncbi:MAG: hypothetical protein MUC43_14915 [Pirellula sp.]|jgi:hypothetical protein|nr:hypothetical protein [Pirellula sp.]
MNNRPSIARLIAYAAFGLGLTVTECPAQVESEKPVDDLKIHNTVSQIYLDRLNQTEQSWLDSGWSKVVFANVP